MPSESSARRIFATLQFCVALLLGSALACRASGTGSTNARPPNVVFIMADDLGWGELGCYGQQKIETPRLDRLAREGLRFTQFYAGAPVCAPSRCVLLTGRHPGHAIVRDNFERGGWGPNEPEGQFPLPPGTETLGTAFQRGGFATAAIGKWGLGGPGTSGEPNRQGFDLFYGYLCQRVAHNLFPTHLWRNTEREDLPGNTWGNAVGETYAHDRMTEEALAFVRAQRERPFFLYLPYHLPHLALQAPQDALEPYVGRWDDPPYDGKKGYLPHPTPRAAYAAMVTRIDRDVGRLLDLLHELGLEENTAVFFTSDNGATYDVGGADSPFFDSAGPLRGAKGSVYEGGLRVPLIVRWPGHVPAGATTDRIAAFYDVLPTLTELAGLPAPTTSDGESFLPTLLGREQEARGPVYWEFPGYGGQQAVRHGRWKAVRRNLREGKLTLALYDLENDVGERIDVAAQHPDLVRRMEALMRSEHVASSDFPLPLLDD